MLTIIQGDALIELRKLPSESVQCCVTSPPYWGLRCYGVEGQYGLEPTPEEYCAKMVEVFREVRRVLRRDGTLWLNLGDSYASGEIGRHDKISGTEFTSQWNLGDGATDRITSAANGISRSAPFLHKRQTVKFNTGLKPKDLIGIPWRLAFALQADGWWLRSDIIWHKPNPMPESCTDRPTKSHEYLFLLTKSATYFFDQEAIREKYVSADESPRAESFNGVRDKAIAEGATGFQGALPQNRRFTNSGRNKRTVWTVATAPYPEAHFATYPPDLIKPCILAGTSARGCCPKCGAPWERVMEVPKPPKCERTPPRPQLHGNDSMAAGVRAKNDNWNGPELSAFRVENPIKTVGWNPGCECYDWLCDERLSSELRKKPVPCTVLDPFAGSGTTGQVALELGRKAVLIELNPAYVKLIEERCNVTPGLALA